MEGGAVDRVPSASPARTATSCAASGVLDSSGDEVELAPPPARNGAQAQHEGASVSQEDLGLLDLPADGFDEAAERARHEHEATGRVAERIRESHLIVACLRRERSSIKAALDGERGRLNDFEAQCESHVQMQERCQQLLLARMEMLHSERRDLETRCRQQDAEQEDVFRRAAAADAHQAETELRIQKLMDQMVKLLAGTPSADAARAQIGQVLEELQASERRLQRQLQSLHEQTQGARLENRRAALDLSEEQQRTKKLHDTLCDLQSELFRTNRARRWQSHRAPEGERQDGLQQAAAVEEPLVQLPVSRGAEAEAAAGPRPPQPPVAAAIAAAAMWDAEAAAPVGQAQFEERRPSPPPGSAEASPAPPPVATAGVPATTLAPSAPAPATLPAEMQALQVLKASMSLEEQLRQVLELVQFENLVIRLAAGLYQFGDSVSAFVQVRPDGQLYASEDQVRYELLEAFIRRITPCGTTPISSAPLVTPVQSMGSDAQAAQEPASVVRATAEAVLDQLEHHVGASSGQRPPPPRPPPAQDSYHQQHAMPTPPGPSRVQAQAGSRKAWSPPPPRVVATVARVAPRVRSPVPRKGETCEDPPRRLGASLELGKNSNLRSSPHSMPRTVRGSGPASRAEHKPPQLRGPGAAQLTTLTVVPPVTGAGPQSCMASTSPPRRAASPKVMAPGLGRCTSETTGAFVQNAVGGNTFSNYAGGYGSTHLPPGIMQHAASTSVASTPPRELSPTPIGSSRAATPTCTADPSQAQIAGRAVTPRDMAGWRRQPQPLSPHGFGGLAPCGGAASLSSPPGMAGAPTSRPVRAPQAGLMSGGGFVALNQLPGLQLSGGGSLGGHRATTPVQQPRPQPHGGSSSPWQLAAGGQGGYPQPPGIASARTSSTSPTRFMAVPTLAPGVRQLRR